MKQLSTLRSSTLEDLLALFPYWNENPTHRQKIKELTSQLQIPNSSFLIPNSVNAIAAEIYSRLDFLTGKYGLPNGIPA
ncbi:MAG: hypothetical protein NC311_11175 [Muribaculaceae bacterium]|nr:hypothetical protein [Muribaculaceae bacterium]